VANLFAVKGGERGLFRARFILRLPPDSFILHPADGDRRFDGEHDHAVGDERDGDRGGG
jgi:hypothetical protein